MTWDFFNKLFSGWKLLAIIVLNSAFMISFRLDFFDLENLSIREIVVLLASVLFALSYKLHLIFCPGPMQGIKNIDGYSRANLILVETELGKNDVFKKYPVKNLTENDHSSDFLSIMFEHDRKRLAIVRYALTVTTLACLAIYFIVDIEALATYIHQIISALTTT